MDKTSSASNRWRRFAEWEERPLNLDRFAVEDAENGFAVFSSPYDPKPSVEVSDGKLLSMDGRKIADFDIIDRFIAAHHLDLTVAETAMGMDSLSVARMLVDINVPREELEKLARGMTPAKLADVVGKLSALEIAFAYSKMRQRKAPGN